MAALNPSQESPPRMVQNGERMWLELASPSSYEGTPSPSKLSLALSSPEGIDCYGNERQALASQTKFYNCKVLSDITLVVGSNSYYAHRLILVKSSDVFERMLSQEWTNGVEKKELELVEDAVCNGVFPRFLRFLYGCHIKLNIDNTLPVLVLADKYNVIDLRNVCVNFACSYIIPKLQLKEVFHVWFQYAIKCYHRNLVSACVHSLAEKMDDITTSVEWEEEWLNLEKEQLIEILKSSDLSIKDEYELWKAVERRLYCTTSPKSPTTATPIGEDSLKELLDYIRFPMMTPEQLSVIETSDLYHKFPELFRKHLMLAYKYHALPLTVRATVKEFTNTNFLLRNYMDLRWDKRFVIPHYSSCPKWAEVSFRFSTRSSSFPPQTWEWEVKIHPRGISSTTDDFRAVLHSNLILDQPRPVEYHLSLVSDKEILHSVSGKKNFSKTRYSTDTEIDKKVSVADLCQPGSPLVVDDSLILQIILKPVE